MLEPGEVAAGDSVERLGGGEAHPTVVELMDAWYDVEPDAALLERVLAAPIAIRDRAGFEKKLARVSRLEIQLEPDAGLAVVDDSPRSASASRNASPRPDSASTSGMLAAPSAKPRPLSPISARTRVSSIATRSRTRASARREPYLTAFVKSSLTSSRTAKRTSP